ncbi:AMP-binding protein [Streptomyces asiaticus]
MITERSPTATLPGGGTHHGSASTAPRPGRPPSPALTLDALFARTARRRPSAIAVREGDGRLTYAEAELRAGQLASALIRAGVQLGDPVIVHCDDHRQSVVAQLAVLKAGGVCVPVSRERPAPETAAVARLSGARDVLRSRSTHGAWNGDGLTLILDDARTWSKLNAVRPDTALPRSGPTDAAYLLVADGGGHAPGGVSGTGQLVDHHAWQLALSARLRRAGLAERAVAVRQPPTGARSLSAMWWAFACGGTLETRSCDGELVRAVLAPRSSTVVFSPEEYPLILEAAAGASRPPGHRATVLVGEPCPRDVIQRHFEVLPGTSLLAEFVPAGGTLPWTVQEFSPGIAECVPPGGVGSPLPHVDVRIIDAAGRALPPGGVGEIRAGGPALPFDSVGVHGIGQEPPAPGTGPFHRSGWLGRWRTDGVVEVTGPLRRAG